MEVGGHIIASTWIATLGDPMPPSVATTAVGILVETKLPGWQIAQYIAHYETRYENTDRGKTTEYTAKNALNTS